MDEIQVGLAGVGKEFAMGTVYNMEDKKG